MGHYDKFSDDDLMESYTNMIDYSGKPSPEILAVIEERGGIANFKRKIENKKIYNKEVARLAVEIESISSEETTPDFIKGVITSEILSKDELSKLIDKIYKQKHEMTVDRKVSSKTLISCAIGIFISVVICGISWAYSMVYYQTMHFEVLVWAYWIGYLIIWLLTKQSRNNIAVFISSVISLIGTIVLGFALAGIFQ